MMSEENNAIADGFARLVIALEIQAEVALAKQKLSPERRDELILASKELRVLATNIVETMGGDDGAIADVWGLVSATCLIMDPEEHKLGIARSIQHDSTRHARDSRANSAAKQALMNAVIALHGNKKCERPSKEAGAILSAVNDRLASNGFAPVLVDVVRRCLEKFPLSDRTQ